MKWMRLAVLGIGGCSEGSTDPTPTEPVDTGHQGACGEVSSMALTLSGVVEDEAGAAVEGADVVLVERAWQPGEVHALDATSAGGTFELAASALPVVEGCWGSAVSLWLVVTAGTAAGEKHVTGYVEDAWASGADRVDLPVPVVVR